MLKKELQSYYTKNNYITNYMVHMLDIRENDIVLEPCGGDGQFIDELLYQNKFLNIDTYEIDKNAIKKLKEKYSEYKNINIYESDTLLDEKLDSFTKNGYYTKIIGNPPYGGWQDLTKRKLLKKKYPNAYVKETYSLFLHRCLSLLKQDGILTFIIPDTFLYLNQHRKIRKIILEKTLIKQIIIFPSKLFPGISFGYSNLCIITLRKTDVIYIENKIEVIQGILKNDDFVSIYKKNYNNKLKSIYIDQKEILERKDNNFLLNDKKINNYIDNCMVSLGDIAHCMTGIYCGDNQKYLATLNLTKNYQTVKIEEVDINCNSILGVSNKYKFVPLVKGSPKEKYFCSTNNWFIDWREETIIEYKSNKKARFQNSNFYFKTGIALPMVKSSKIKAIYFEKSVFDQSIVGIFPKEKTLFNFLLAYLNSNIANKFIHTINPTANNSANYIKRLPIFYPSKEDLNYINKLICLIKKNGCNLATQKQIDDFFEIRFNEILD